MLAAVGIVRELSSWEASATRDSVWMEFSGTLRWRVAKNVIRACIVWCAFGAWFVQVEHSLCWKKEVGVLLGCLRQSAQKIARISGRGTGDEGRRCEWGVRSAVATHVKHIVHRWVKSPCLSQLYPCGAVVPHMSHGATCGCAGAALCASSDVVRHSLHRLDVVWEVLFGLAFHCLAAGRVHVWVSHVFMRGGSVVSFRSLRSMVMWLSSRVCRVISLEIDGCDHWVRPGVNGVLGDCEVNIGEEW